MDDLVILGGGPSGLAAATEAIAHGAKVSVLERQAVVGGLSRTTVFEGNRFDIGPHRFFTKNREIHRLFVETVAEDLLTVPRLTRIFYKDRYFNYPLTPFNALFGVGAISSLSILSSYATARLRRTLGNVPIENFEDWIVDRFGRRLFETFFKTYTEKVWGIPCSQISAGWAAQRIKGLSLTTAAMNALFKTNDTIKTLADEFIYPRLGAGQLYEKMAANVLSTGNRVITGTRVIRIHHHKRCVSAAEVEDKTGHRFTVEGRQFLTSVPLTETVRMMSPEPHYEVLAACRALRYRNHIGVNLVVEGRPFPDNWIYVHSKDVGMARIANYANFSPGMAARPGLNPLTVEYFCSPGDDMWHQTDNALIKQAKRELIRMKILQSDQLINSFVVRSNNAYPVIEMGYEKHIGTIKRWLDQFQNLFPIGRSGMFKYNNQDHAMATGVLAARTALGLAKYDPWMVNVDAEYHENSAAERKIGCA